MPKQSCRDRPIWPPLLSYLDEHIGTWLRLACELVICRMKGDITLWHHVRTKQSHQQVNVRCPFADSFELHQLQLYFGVGKLMNLIEIDVFADEGLGQMPRISRLLSAKTDHLHLCAIEREYT